MSTSIDERLFVVKNKISERLSGTNEPTEPQNMLERWQSIPEYTL